MTYDWMVQLLTKKLLIGFTVFFMLLSLPSILHKMRTEQSAPVVEYSVDYFSLLNLNEQTNKPGKTLPLLFEKLIDMQIQTVTLGNNSLMSLEKRGILNVLTEEQVDTIRFLSDDDALLDQHKSYISFIDKDTKQEIIEILNARFPENEIKEIKTMNRELVSIDISRNRLVTLSLPFLKSDIDYLTKEPQQFKLVLKVDNKWDDQEQVIIDQLNEIDPAVVSKIYFADAGVIGFPTTHLKYIKQLPATAFAYKEYFSPSTRQKGMDALARATDNQFVRMHVLDASLISENLDDSKIVPNRIALAANERNIRLFHIQLPVSVTDKEPMEVFESTLSILANSQEKLKVDGLTIGYSTPFTQKNSSLLGLSRWSALFAGISLISLVILQFLPKWTPISFMGLSLLSLSSLVLGSTPFQAVTLLIAIFIPLASILWMLKYIEKHRTMTMLKTSLVFLAVCALSILFSLILVGIHSDATYILYLEQFRGVSIAHLLPIGLMMGVLLIHFRLATKERLVQLLSASVKVSYLLAIGIVALAGIYYLSRTGNSGVMMPFEAEFRAMLDELLGVRPRTKEFLIAHPLLMIIIYYWHRYNVVKWLLPLAIIGQLSIVNTFTHLHTPVLISAQRAIYGGLFGLAIGLILVFVINLGINCYRKTTLTGNQ